MINPWGWPQENQSIPAAIARHCELSPRLAHSIDPSAPARRTEPASRSLNGSRLAANIPSPPSSMSDVFEAVWHFGSVDFSRHYIYIGWNALFFLPRTHKSAFSSKPNAMRVWSTVLLCDDGTVVSIFEQPSATDHKMWLRARRNQTTIFEILSSVKQDHRNPLLQTAKYGRAASVQLSGKLG